MNATAASWFRWQDRALLLEVTIQPGAAKSQIVGLHGELLKIRIQAPPVDGKANRSLIEFLALEFKTPRSRVSVVRGETSRTKSLRIDAPARLPEILVALGLNEPIHKERSK